MEANIILIMLHLILLPFVFQILKYLRIEEMFKRGTPPVMIKLIYAGLCVAFTQLIISYFSTIFTLIDGLF